MGRCGGRGQHITNEALLYLTSETLGECITHLQQIQLKLRKTGFLRPDWISSLKHDVNAGQKHNVMIYK